MTNDASRTADRAGQKHTQVRPWPALWAMVIGFFMILVDTTIVSVANPAIKAALDPGTNSLDNVVWVTSAYLLGYAVPLLITGRMGDRFGPRNIYLIGLAIFTLSSLGCGLSTSLGSLIAMRAVQGIGASMMTPQTMAVITRTFPPQQRGAADQDLAGVEIALGGDLAVAERRRFGDHDGTADPCRRTGRLLRPTGKAGGEIGEQARIGQRPDQRIPVQRDIARPIRP